jgi:hypothetical protein
MKKTAIIFLALGMIFLGAGAGYAGLKGDLNENTLIDLADAILALQSAGGANPDGVDEAMFVLQVLTNRAIVSQGQAVLGPLSGAAVRVYRLTEFKNVFENY